MLERSSNSFLRSSSVEKKGRRGRSHSARPCVFEPLEQSELASAIQMNGDDSPAVRRSCPDCQAETPKRHPPKNDRASAVAAWC